MSLSIACAIGSASNRVERALRPDSLLHEGVKRSVIAGWKSSHHTSDIGSAPRSRSKSTDISLDRYSRPRKVLTPTFRPKRVVPLRHIVPSRRLGRRPPRAAPSPGLQIQIGFVSEAGGGPYFDVVGLLTTVLPPGTLVGAHPRRQAKPESQPAERIAPHAISPARAALRIFASRSVLVHLERITDADRASTAWRSSKGASRWPGRRS